MDPYGSTPLHGKVDPREKSTASSPRISPPSEKEETSAADDANPPNPAPPYSRFTKAQKRLIVFIVTFAATFSPLSSFIFFPAIKTLSQSLQVSVEKITLTITSYMIVSGIAPAVMGDIADKTGRRIVYLLTYGIYLVANIALAVQTSWTALFLLRMLQSAGGAGALCEIFCRWCGKTTERLTKT